MSEERLWKFRKPEWMNSAVGRSAGVYAAGALVCCPFSLIVISSAMDMRSYWELSSVVEVEVELAMGGLMLIQPSHSCVLGDMIYYECAMLIYHTVLAILLPPSRRRRLLALETQWQ